MTSHYSQDQLKISVAKILQTIGWHSINTTPLDILTDVLAQYLSQIGKTTNDNANEFGFVEPNLDHLGLAFRDFHIHLPDLEEYVTYVNFGQGPTPTPNYPVSKENHLNFLKPGSNEVIARPVHIHEHLPPMYPLLESAETDSEGVVKKEEVENLPTDENSAVFKKPAEVTSNEPFKRPRLLMEEEGGRPTREISSVMMTTSGFLSPAREGKLPESRTPLAAIESAPPVNVSPAPTDLSKKPTKVVKKVERKKVGKELFKVDEKVKRVGGIKDVSKFKQVRAQAPNSVNNSDSFKMNKALAAALQKTEKLNTTITPIPMKINPPLPQPPDHIDKLFTEPDKKKVNILKKISNVKNEKPDLKLTKLKEEPAPISRESSPDLIIDETPDSAPKVHHISDDITIELIQCPPTNSERAKRAYSDDDSPPGTPSTPKTPEMVSHSPPIPKEKRKRKDKAKVKKVQKLSPAFMDHESMDVELDRPKTPEAPVTPKPEPMPLIPPMPYQFYPNFGCPGLIPPLNNALYPPIQFPIFGQRPPFLHQNLPMKLLQQKFEEIPPEAPEKLPIIPIVAPETPPVGIVKSEKKTKEHKKEKRDKIKKKNKKDRLKNKAEKKKLKEEKKEKIKKEKKEKRKDKELRESEGSVPKLTLKLGSASPCSETQERKLNIKPIIKKEEECELPLPVEPKSENGPELAKISALVTGQPKQRISNPPIVNSTTSTDNYPTSSTDSFYNQPKKSMFKPIPKIRPIKVRKESTDMDISIRTPPSKYVDAEGNEVWICPACGVQDDGSPMIGCDDCDAWYHWVCVGIQIAPHDNEDWYCRHCIVKKQEVLQTDKKKKRKKREKKNIVVN